MKNIRLFCCLLLLLTVAACRKENSRKISGTWRLNISSADTTARCAVFVENAIKNNIYVVFNDDGTLGGNAFPQNVKYQTGDNDKLILYTSVGTSTEYVYKINKNVLNIYLSIIYFTTPSCGIITYIK